MGGVSNIEIIDPIGGINITATGDIGGATTFLANDAGAQIITLGGSWFNMVILQIQFTKLLQEQKLTTRLLLTVPMLTLTVKQVMADLDAAQTITGGSGTDILELTADGGSC